MNLDVHLYGERVGTLFPAGEDDWRFAYAPEVVERTGAGASLLSTALPARPEPFGADATRAYVEGLLPEGERRERIARELGLDPGDGYGLLAEVGRDCAGAVFFLPQGAEAPFEPGPASWLSEDDLEGLVRRRPPQLPSDRAARRVVRATLAGERHKLALVREEPGGRWGLPGPGRPSTHVLKPETGEYPDLVANEMFCMSVARDAGLRVADTELETIAGVPCLVSRRFDRAGEGEGATRIHQEDFCQALGFPPGAGVGLGLEVEVGDEIDGGDEIEVGYEDEIEGGYEDEIEGGYEDGDEDGGGDEDGDLDAAGPDFAECCGLLTAVGRRDDVPALLSAAVCNYALGNGDAHGKNFALLYGKGGPRLAPFYDLTSTVVYDLPLHTGMVLAEEYAETAYLLEMDFICRECDYGLDRFRELVAATAAKIERCLEAVAERARREGWHAPVIDDIVELAEERARGLGYEVEY